jgi:hypothetical protein
LHVYSLVQTKLLIAYVSIWQNTRLELLLLTLRWYLSCLYMFVLLEIEIHMFVVTLLKLLHVCYLLMVSLWGLTLVFTNLGIMVEYIWLNTCLYNLGSTLILISYIASHAFLDLWLMSSLSNGKRMCIMLVELFC